MTDIYLVEESSREESSHARCDVNDPANYI